MGNLVRIDGVLWHETGDGREEIAFAGDTPLEGVIDGGDVQIRRDGKRVVISGGGTHISMTSETAANLFAGLAAAVPDAETADVDAKLEIERARLAAQKDRVKADAAAEIALEVANAQAELDRIKAELEEAKREASDLPKRP